MHFTSKIRCPKFALSQSAYYLEVGSAESFFKSNFVFAWGLGLVSEEGGEGFF